MPDSALTARILSLAERLEPDLVELRRDLHSHPELGRTEQRTAAVVTERLTAAGLSPRPLAGTGVVCDVGPAPVRSGRRRVALRADLDALPVPDLCGRPWCSTTPGLAHACGHDVHVAVVVGAALVLADLAASGDLSAGVRLVFQPAEEVQPSGALDVVEAGAMEGVSRVFAVHCDPRLDAGRVGLRPGALTSAIDSVVVHLSGPGGHTSRPHLTGDLVFALGQVITQVPAVLGRRLDPRSGVNLTWGSAHAGSTSNVIPAAATLEGTLRCLDERAWQEAGVLLTEAIEQVVAPYGVAAEVRHSRGVPPVNNDPESTALLQAATGLALGEGAVQPTEQSLGGEDFAWYLTKVPGAMARLGTRTPGGHTYDLHQGDIDVDERAIRAGVALLSQVAVLAGDA